MNRNTRNLAASSRRPSRVQPVDVNSRANASDDRAGYPGCDLAL